MLFSLWVTAAIDALSKSITGVKLSNSEVIVKVKKKDLDEFNSFVSLIVDATILGTS